MYDFMVVTICCVTFGGIIAIAMQLQRIAKALEEKNRKTLRDHDPPRTNNPS